MTCSRPVTLKARTKLGLYPGNSGFGSSVVFFQTFSYLVLFLLFQHLAAAGPSLTAHSKASTCQCRRHKRLSLSPLVRKIPGEGNGNPPQSSCLGNPVAGYSPWGARDLDLLLHRSVSVLFPALHHPDYCSIALKSGGVRLTAWFLFSVVFDIVDSFLLCTNCRISLPGPTK